LRAAALGDFLFAGIIYEYFYLRLLHQDNLDELVSYSLTNINHSQISLSVPLPFINFLSHKLQPTNSSLFKCRLLES